MALDFRRDVAARFAHAMRHEMAVAPEDVARRLARWYDIDHPAAARRVAAWMEAAGT